MASSQQHSRSQSLVSKAMIKMLGNELIRLYDGIERHSLLDYQYGLWEDQITEGTSTRSYAVQLGQVCQHQLIVVEEILDLYKASEEASGSGS
jgi:hypothetical protein